MESEEESRTEKLIDDTSREIDYFLNVEKPKLEEIIKHKQELLYHTLSEVINVTLIKKANKVYRDLQQKRFMQKIDKDCIDIMEKQIIKLTHCMRKIYSHDKKSFLTLKDLRQNFLSLLKESDNNEYYEFLRRNKIRIDEPIIEFE